MHDELALRVGDRIEDVQKQQQTPLERQRALATVPVDGDALDVFQNQVRLSVLAHARIEEPGDVSMRQPGEQARLVADPREGRGGAETAALEQLDGRPSLEFVIAAATEPHAPHAAAPEHALDRVRAHLLSDQRIVRLQERALEEAGPLDRRMQVEQFAQPLCDVRFRGVELREPGLARPRIHLQSLIQARGQALPELAVHRQ